jgi:hypothetical protein
MRRILNMMKPTTKTFAQKGSGHELRIIVDREILVLEWRLYFALLPFGISRGATELAAGNNEHYNNTSAPPFLARPG